MAAKVNNFSELSNILSGKMRIASSISKLHGIFRIPQIVHGLGMEKEKGVQADGKPRCLIVDDTVLEKTGAHNRMEHISRVYDHAGTSMCSASSCSLWSTSTASRRSPWISASTASGGRRRIVA